MTRYDDYIASSAWRRTRDKRLKYGVWIGDVTICELCGLLRHRGRGIEVHHTSYERLGWERFGDLLAVCRDCHGRLEGAIDWLTVRMGSRRQAMRRLLPAMHERLIARYDAWGAMGYPPVICQFGVRLPNMPRTDVMHCLAKPGRRKAGAHYFSRIKHKLKRAPTHRTEAS